MYKLMVVDDEYNICVGISECVDWKKYDIEVVISEQNPHTAIEQAHILRPDIAIVDIELSSDINGLDIISILKEHYPEMKFIILSGYDRFEFAQQAIALAIERYLLKPILAEDLENTVLDVIKTLEKNKTKEQEQVYSENRKCVRSIIESVAGDGVWNPEETRDLLDKLDPQYADNAKAVSLVSLDEINNDVVVALTQFIATMDMLAIKANCKQNYIISTISGSQKIVCIMFAKSNEMRAKLERLLVLSREQVMENLNIKCSIGFSSWNSSTDNLRMSFFEAKDAINCRFIMSQSGVYRSGEHQFSGDVIRFRDLQGNKIINALTSNNSDVIVEEINHFFDAIVKEKLKRESIVVIVNELFFTISNKILEIDKNADIYLESMFDGLSILLSHCSYLNEVRNWMVDHIIDVVDEFALKQEQTDKTLITEVQNYINLNYANFDLSLKAIADHFYITGEYLSVIFKAKTGQRFIDYLTELRISKAKVLLEKSNMRVGDIGERVGYGNSQYFCTLFKKLVGVSPKEYRKKS